MNKREPVDTYRERVERRRLAVKYNAAFIGAWPWMFAGLGYVAFAMLIANYVEPGGAFSTILGLSAVITGAISIMGLYFALLSAPERPHARAVEMGFMAAVEELPDLPDIHGTARWATEEELEARGMLLDPHNLAERAKRILLGVVSSGRLLTHAVMTGIITVGAPGTGKFITSIALNLFNWTLGSVWVFDPKGEITAVTAGFRARFSKTIIINPFGVLYTTPEERARFPDLKPSRFNPLDALLEATDFDDVAANIAARLISGVEGRDDFWLQGARSLMAGVIAYLFHAETAVDEDGEPFPKTITGIASFLQQSPDTLVAHARMAMGDKRECMYLARSGMVEWASATGDPSKAGAKRNASTRGEWPKSTLETLFTLRRQLDELLRSSGIRETLSGSDFKWSDLRRKKCSVYVVLPADKVERFERFTSLLLDDALETFAAPPRPGDLPIYMILDEVATALHKRMKWIGRAYGLSRGQRFIIHSYFQNWSQVRSAFKNPGEIVGAAGTLQFYRNHDSETIEVLRGFGGRFTEWLHMVSRNVGFKGEQKAQQNAQSSEGYGYSWQHHAQDLITPELVREGLGTPGPDNGFTARQIIVSEGLAAPILAGRQAYFKHEPAWGKHHNPYAPPGPHNPPPDRASPQPEPRASGLPPSRASAGGSYGE